ncbi:MAG: GNAT family N-acetyltransferase [Aestuariivirgaceae bacterium]
MSMITETEQHEFRARRFRLRPFRADDAGRLVSLLGDYDVCKMLSRVPYPYTRAQAVHWIGQNSVARPADETGFAIDMGDGVVGGIGFRLIDQVPDVGFWLARPQWGRGLMSQVARLALEWLFEGTDHDNVSAGFFEGNAASWRVQEKLGFEITGQSSVHCLAQGRDLPHIDTLLTRRRFEMLNR